MKFKDSLTVASKVLGIMTTIIAIYTFFFTKKVNETAEAARVMAQNLGSMDNRPDLIRDSPNDSAIWWHKWLGYNLPGFHIIGVSRIIPFQRTFKNKPKISISITQNGFRSVQSALNEIGLKVKDEDIAKGGYFPGYYYTESGNVPDSLSTKECKICIGVAVPGYAYDSLVNYLEKKQPRPSLDTEMVLQGFYRELHHGEVRTDDEKWTENFYDLVGTCDLNWIAIDTTSESK